MTKLLDWFERYRVVTGGILTLVIIAIGGLLIWYDRHPAVATVTTTKVIGQTTSPSQSEVSSTQSNSDTININTASLSQLDSLPGIGPAYAQRIIDYRNSHGNFRSIHDVVLVKGIGEGTYAKIKDMITTGGE